MSHIDIWNRVHLRASFEYIGYFQIPFFIYLLQLYNTIRYNFDTNSNQFEVRTLNKMHAQQRLLTEFNVSNDNS